MKFTWDENKRLANIKKHGIDFADVPPMFDGDVFTIEDLRFEYSETRYITFGLLKFRVIVVAHTDENDVIRIVSARKAAKNEEKQYFKEIGDRF
ncbi:MAG: BrnT family toxin [Anaerolineales bacterium]|nr:BrnT family toxin [Anaerolineales bacterium]